MCGANAVPIGAHLDAYVARLDAGIGRALLAPYRIGCGARLDAANGEAQGTYFAYAAFVMLAAAGCGFTLRRRVN